MKKRIALLLVFMLLVSLLTACGEEESSAKKGKTREGQNSSASVTPTPNPDGPDPTDGPEPTDGPVPTDMPQPTDMPDPTPTPTAKPATPTPTPVITTDEFTYDRPNVALLAFSDYIDDMYAGLSEEEQEDFRFGLLLLNSDETPELWWTDGDYHASAVHICIYDGKKVKDIGSFGSFGGCSYLEYQSLVTSGYMAMGTSIFGVYELHGTEFETRITLMQKDNDDGSSTYYIDDIECTKEEYEEEYDYWDLASWEIEYDDGYDLYWEMDYDDEIVSSYNLLFPEYADWYDEYPFEYDVPDDILEVIVGKWELTGGENDGRKWSASEYGAVSYVTFNEDCTVTVEDVVPDPQTEEFDLLYLYWQGLTEDGEKWIVCYTYENENTSDAEYVYTLLKDGSLVRFYFDYDNGNEAITYYKKVK